jgi:hypothetical protein
VKRRTLDQMGPDEGTRLRVYFPHGGGIREMTASGETRASSSDRCEFDHRLDDEWVPGWYVVQMLGRVGAKRRIM